jgi:hypothetical protein
MGSQGFTQGSQGAQSVAGGPRCARDGSRGRRPAATLLRDLGEPCVNPCPLAPLRASREQADDLVVPAMSR